VSESIDLEEGLPEDLTDSEQYEAVPHRRDLALGKRVALSFIEQELPAFGGPSRRAVAAVSHVLLEGQET
jgi:hypothetical protein